MPTDTETQASGRLSERRVGCTGPLKVLLVGESVQGSSFLLNRLWQQGCRCEFAATYEEIRALLRAKDIYLVLCPTRLDGRNLLPLIDLLEGSNVSLFYSASGEQGCWWLPALRHGDRCFGSCAVRPSEFISVLDELIAAGRLGTEPAAKQQRVPAKSQ